MIVFQGLDHAGEAKGIPCEVHLEKQNGKQFGVVRCKERVSKSRRTSSHIDLKTRFTRKKYVLRENKTFLLFVAVRYGRIHLCPVYN